MSTPTQIGATIGLVFLFIIASLMSLVFWMTSFWFWQAIIPSSLCLIMALTIAGTIYRESKQ